MIVNINPGCLFGGSATEYFVGDFDGTKFTCDSDPSVAKFLDYGRIIMPQLPSQVLKTVCWE